MKNLHSNKKGVALLTVVLFFLVMVILLGGLLFATVNNLKNTQTAQKHTSVYYAAESGINLQVARILDLFDLAISENWLESEFNIALSTLINDINNDLYTETLKDNLGKPVFASISISEPFELLDYPNHTFYTIESIGNIDGVQRTLTTNFGYELVVGDGIVANLSGAIITNGSIHIQNGTVHGSVASNLDDGSTFTIRSQITDTNCSSINSDTEEPIEPGITLPFGSNSSDTPCDAYDINTMEEGDKIVFSDIVLPTFPATSELINLDGSALFTASKLTLPDPGIKEGYILTNLNRNQNYTIDLGNWLEPDEYVKLRITGTMNFARNYTVTGTGKLMILYDHKSNFTITGRMNHGFSDPTKLLLVLKSNTSNPSFSIHQNASVVASIISDSTSDLFLPARGFFGFIATNAGYDDYSGTVSISANSQVGSEEKPPIWIYAPYAHVSMNGNSYFYGTVMSNSFDMNASGSHLIYKAPTYGYPFAEWTPLPTIDNGNPTESSISFVISPIKEN